MPRLLIVHATAGASDEGDVQWCRTSQAELDAKHGKGKYSAVSYHYIVGRKGTVYQLVQDERRAWHAGISTWNGRANCNDYSIGVALSNRGDGEAYTPDQYASLAGLCVILMQRWNIPLERLVGHCHVSPGRKTDPYLKFEWTRLAADIVRRTSQP